MQYMLMLIGEEPNFEELPVEDMQRDLEAMGAFNKQLEEAGVMVTGNGLRERATATTVHFDLEGNATVTDGPFAETKEQLMGYWILECSSLDEALDWTKKVPMHGASIEVRPLVEEQGETDEDFTAEKLLERVQSRGD